MVSRESISAWLRRPIGRGATVAIALVALLMPAYLFADPIRNYWVRGDDWEYVASSRTLDRTLANLLRPHNVHVVPAWRLLTWGVVALAGRLLNVRPMLGMAAYLILAATLLLAGRLVASETRRPLLGLAAIVSLGSTSLLYPAGTWYSASQALAAADCVLVMLLFLLGYRRAGGAWRLALAAVATAAAGCCWTAGYVAGPVGTAYLLADRRGKSLRVAAIPFLAAAVAAGTIFVVCRRDIDAQSTISFHGRKTEEAVHVWLGPAYVIQAIPERLAAGALGLATETTFEQGAVLVLVVALAWGFSRRDYPSPLEAAGLTLMAGSYLILMTFRTYLPFSSLRGQIPWYDAIPAVGAVLFVSGWWAGLLGDVPGKSPAPVRRVGLVGLVGLQAALLVLNVPRVNTLFQTDVNDLLIRMTVDEREHRFPIPMLRRLWAIYTASEYVARQDRQLARLDHAEKLARTAGIGRDALAALYGRSVWPDPPVIDDADLLALPKAGTLNDPARIRALIGPGFALDPPMRPPWIPPDERWPPPKK